MPARSRSSLINQVLPLAVTKPREPRSEDADIQARPIDIRSRCDTVSNSC